MASFNVTAMLSLNNARFLSGLKAAGSAVSGLAGIAGRVAGIIGALGAPLTAGAFAVGVKDALDFGSSLTDLANRTGAPIRDLVMLQEAFTMSGLSAEQVGPAINRLQKALAGTNEAGEPTNKTFQKLGLNMEALLAMSPSEQFLAVGKAISSVTDPAERTAAAMALFGRTGGEMLALFRDPEALAAAFNMTAAQADVLARKAAVFDFISDRIGSVKTSLRGFFVGFADAFTPALTAFAGWLESNGPKLVAIGQQFGAWLQSGVTILTNAFGSGQLGELLRITLMIGFAESVNAFIGMLRSSLLIIPAVFFALFSGDSLTALGAGFIGLAEKFGVAILRIFGDAIAFMAAGLQVAIEKVLSILPESLGGTKGHKVTPFAEALDEQRTKYQPEFVGAISKHADENLAASGAAVSNIMGKIGSDLKAIAVDFTPSEVFDTSALKTQLGNLVTSLKPGEFVGPLLTPGDQQKKTGEALGEGFGKKVEAASALERIGAIIPGAGGVQASAIGYARKTADTLADIHKGFERGIKIQQDSVGAVATWA